MMSGQWSKRVPSPIGELLLLAGENGLMGIWMVGQRIKGSGGGRISPEQLEEHGQAMQFPEGYLEGDNAILEQAQQWLLQYFQGKRPDPRQLPLSPSGTPFQQQVWERLLEIPYGCLTTYGAIAREISRKQGGVRVSPQAVGGAVGRNPLSIVVPCHRVVGANGSLTGYAGGLARKRWLLTHEGVAERITPEMLMH